MIYDDFNQFCGGLTATAHVIQWGNAHVWKVGGVAGKVFAIGGWEKRDEPAYTFKVSQLNFDVLQDQPGFRPAPYMAARGMRWIQQYSRLNNPDDQLRYYLQQSHQLVALGLTKKKRGELGLYVESSSQ